MVGERRISLLHLCCLFGLFFICVATTETFQPNEKEISVDEIRDNWGLPLQNHTVYSETFARKALLFSEAAYCNSSSLMLWNCTACNKFPQFKPFQLLQNTSYQTYAFLGVAPATNSEPDYLVLSFRGTNPGSLQNWITNLRTSKVVPYPTVADAQVHAGFFLAYLSVADKLQRAMSILLTHYPDAHVLITGHSLGGALATIAATDLLMRQVTVDRFVTLVSFGQPRVGNRVFQQLFELSVTTSWRLVHAYDLVPHLPLNKMGFWHIPTEIWYTRDNSHWDECDGSGEDPLCSASLYWATSLHDHLNYLGSDVGSNCDCSDSYGCGCHSCEAYHQCGECAAAKGCAWCTASQECRRILSTSETPVLCNANRPCHGCLRVNETECPRSGNCNNYNQCALCTQNKGCAWCTASQQCLPAQPSYIYGVVLCNAADSCDGCLRWAHESQPSGCPPVGQECDSMSNCRSCSALSGCAWCTDQRKCLAVRPNHPQTLCNPTDECQGCLRDSPDTCPEEVSDCEELKGCKECVKEKTCGWCTSSSSCSAVTTNWWGSTIPCAGKCSGCLRHGNQTSFCPATFDSCANISNCSSCINSAGCGWCPSNDQCFAIYEWYGRAVLCNPEDTCESPLLTSQDPKAVCPLPAKIL